MSGPWHDINDPGYLVGRKREEPAHTPATEEESSEPKKAEDPEVKLLSAEWKPGPKGFEHNEQCFVEVKAEFLKKTVRTRLKGKLFGTYAGKEVDLAQEVEGFIDRTSGIARMMIGHLWFVNDPHYAAWRRDPSTPCTYVVKGISHSRGANTIDSEVLSMPPEKKTVLRIRLVDQKRTRKKNLQYTVDFGDGERSGISDENGLVEEDVPDGAGRAKLKLVNGELAEEYEILIGQLEPVSELKGIQARLENLGYAVGPIDGIYGPLTKGAIKGFQHEAGLEQTGKVDETLGEKLTEVHGC